MARLVSTWARVIRLGDLIGFALFHVAIVGVWVLAGACLPENRARARRYRARRRRELERAGYRFRR